jgi:hypothetical protein
VSRLRPLLLAAGAVILVALVLVVLGVTPADATLLALLVGMQSASGAYLWMLARRPSSDRPLDGLEILGGGLALGTGLAVLSGVLLAAVLPGRLGWIAPSLAALVVWVARRVRGTGAVRPCEWRRSSLIGFGVTVVLGLASIALNVARYPLGVTGPWTTYHRDMLYFEGLSTSVAVFGPNDSIFMAGADVRYHWFTYAWAGQLAHTADAAPFATLTRLLPMVALLGCAALVVAWTARLVDRAPATILAGALLVGGGYVGAANGTILNFDSPSQALTTLWLMGILVAALALIRGPARWGGASAVAALGAVTAGGKISTAAVALVSLGLVAVVASIRREEWRRRARLAVGLIALAAAAVYVLFVAGSASAGDLNVLSLDSRASSVQGLDSSPGPRGVMLGTLALILAVAARWWGLAWLVGERQWRWRPDVVLGVGLVVAGIVPLLVLSQGVNETWFALAASAPLAVLSAAGVSVAWSRLQNRAALVASIGSGVVIVLVVPVFWIPDVVSTTSVRFWGPWAAYGLAAVLGGIVALALRSPRGRVALLAGSAITALVVAGALARVSPVVADRLHAGESPAQSEAASGDGASPPAQQSPVSDVPVGPVMTAPAELLTGSPPDRTTWTVDEADAAAALRELTNESDIVVTNDTTSFLVAALGQRLTYLSGAPYQGLYGSEASVAGIPERIATSLAFTRALDEAAFAALCDAGVTWGWIALDGTPLRSWEPYASVAYQNDSVAIVRINEGACP